MGRAQLHRVCIQYEIVNSFTPNVSFRWMVRSVLWTEADTLPTLGVILDSVVHTRDMQLQWVHLRGAGRTNFMKTLVNNRYKDLAMPEVMGRDIQTRGLLPPLDWVRFRYWHPFKYLNPSVWYKIYVKLSDITITTTSGGREWVTYLQAGRSSHGRQGERPWVQPPAAAAASRPVAAQAC